MDTDQVHNQDFQRMALNYVSQELIKAKPARLWTSCCHPIRERVHPDVLPAYERPTCV